MAAILDRAAFFDHVRGPLFGGSLTAEQVQGMDAIFDACPAALPTDPLAYGFATTFREAGPTMQPIREIGRGKGRAYGRPAGPYKQVYYGRGLVQLTWLANYVKVTEKLRKLGLLKADEDLARNPDLAMRPDIAAAILFHGMIEGWFTGKKLSDYFGHGKSNPRGARAIINPRPIRASTVLPSVRRQSPGSHVLTGAFSFSEQIRMPVTVPVLAVLLAVPRVAKGFRMRDVRLGCDSNSDGCASLPMPADL